MKKWYQSKLIWAGVTAVLTSVVAALSTGLDWKAAAIGGLGALVVVLRKYTDTGIAALMFAALIGTTACTGFNLPASLTVSTAENVACYELTASQCFTDVLSTIGIKKDTCEADIEAMISGKVQLNLTRIKDLPRVCRNDLNAVIDYAKRITPR